MQTDDNVLAPTVEATIPETLMEEVVVNGEPEEGASAITIGVELTEVSGFTPVVNAVAFKTTDWLGHIATESGLMDARTPGVTNTVAFAVYKVKQVPNK